MLTYPSPRGSSARDWPIDLDELSGHDVRTHTRDDLFDSLPPQPQEVVFEYTDELDSLALGRVAPERTAAPVRGRLWRPRPGVTEAVSGLAGFVTLVLAVTTPAAAYAGRGLTLALLVAVLLPPVVGWTLYLGATGQRRSTRASLASLSRLLCALGACFAVGLSVGGIGWVVHTAPVDAMALLEPVLVASTYSVGTALSAGLLAWSLRPSASFR